MTWGELAMLLPPGLAAKAIGRRFTKIRRRTTGTAQHGQLGRQGRVPRAGGSREGTPMRTRIGRR